MIQNLSFKQSSRYLWLPRNRIFGNNGKEILGKAAGLHAWFTFYELWLDCGRDSDEFNLMRDIILSLLNEQANDTLTWSAVTIQIEINEIQRSLLALTQSETDRCIQLMQCNIRWLLGLL